MKIHLDSLIATLKKYQIRKRLAIMALYSHIHIQIYAEHNQTQYTIFKERTNTLLYKNIISHTLFLKGWCWLCVRDELETGTDCYIDPKFFFDHSNTSFTSWLGLSPRSASPQSESLFSRWHPISNWLQQSVRLVILLFNVHLLPLFFHLFTQVHLLIDSSVEGQ